MSETLLGAKYKATQAKRMGDAWEGRECKAMSSSKEENLLTPTAAKCRLFGTAGTQKWCLNAMECRFCFWILGWIAFLCLVFAWLDSLCTSLLCGGWLDSLCTSFTCEGFETPEAFGAWIQELCKTGEENMRAQGAFCASAGGKWSKLQAFAQTASQAPGNCHRGCEICLSHTKERRRPQG